MHVSHSLWGTTTASKLWIDGSQCSCYITMLDVAYMCALCLRHKGKIVVTVLWLRLLSNTRDMIRTMDSSSRHFAHEQHTWWCQAPIFDWGRIFRLGHMRKLRRIWYIQVWQTTDTFLPWWPTYLQWLPQTQQTHVIYKVESPIPNLRLISLSVMKITLNHIPHIWPIWPQWPWN